MRRYLKRLSELDVIIITIWLMVLSMLASWKLALAIFICGQMVILSMIIRARNARKKAFFIHGKIENQERIG